jgi:hypothetical protein
MRTWIGIALCAVAILAGVSGSAYAAESNYDAVIAMHIAVYNAKSVCEVTRPNCLALTTSAPPGWYNVYVMIGNVSDSLGIGGVQFGIDYDGDVGVGADILAWANCGDLEFSSGGSDGQPTWPAAGSGNLITWDFNTNCQTEAAGAILVGVFQMAAYSDDCLAVTPRPVDGKAKVASCFGAEMDITGRTPSHLGFVCFGAGEGYNPCSLIVATRHTTWGSIKTLY